LTTTTQPEILEDRQHPFLGIHLAGSLGSTIAISIIDSPKNLPPLVFDQWMTDALFSVVDRISIFSWAAGHG